MSHPLDNPVWEALSSSQSHFNKGNDIVSYFPQDVAPFVGMKKWEEQDIKTLAGQLPAGRTFSVPLAQELILPSSFETIFSIPLYQMHCPVLKPVKDTGIVTRKLGDKDIPMMLELTALTKPGPFYERTIDFGNYIGIFDQDKLVAMAGDRMKINGYTEISAICTHPGHGGKGYASYLSGKAAQRIVEQGDTPFLHVKADNLRAIEVYKKMGFETRADIWYTIFRKR